MLLVFVSLERQQVIKNGHGRFTIRRGGCTGKYRQPELKQMLASSFVNSAYGVLTQRVDNKYMNVLVYELSDRE